MTVQNISFLNLTKKSIRAIPTYVAGESAEMVREKYPDLTFLHKLSSNENQLGPSPKALAAMKKAAENANEYPDPRAKKLKAALGKFYDISSDNVFVTSGATGSLELLTEMFVCPGDEVIYCSPTYMAYTRYVSRNMGVSIELPLTDKLEIDLDAMKNAITDRTKMMIICNPNNPTGTALKKEALKNFIREIPPNIIILLDEAYIEFSDEGLQGSLYPLIKEYRNLVVLRTFSKLYGIAGERVGYTFADAEIIEIMSKSSTFFAVTQMGLMGAIAALEDQEFAQKTIAMVKTGRDLLADTAKSLGWKVYRSQTNFIYIDTGMDAMKLAEKLKEYGVIIRGNFELSRISIGTTEQNHILVEALKDIAERGL